MSLDIKVEGAYLTSLSEDGRQFCSAPSPLFRLRLISPDGQKTELNAADAGRIEDYGDVFVFSGFSADITVKVKIVKGDDIRFFSEIENNSGCAVEWIILLPLHIPALCGDGGEDGSSLLLPYNEGVIVHTLKKVYDMPPEYPSYGNYMMFPNMMFAQTASYQYGGAEPGYLTVSAYDPARGPKEITVRGGELIFKLYCGGEPGQNVSTLYPLVISSGKGGWEAASSAYRDFFESNLPPCAVKVKENDSLPQWYTDNTVVLAYPVRGIHDMDKMEPNALFPYVRALPLIDDIAARSGMRPLALLMHWEGTAPWAPPYVWPPYGGVDAFNEFRDELHRRGYMLGVYCSGFGFTEHSNLVETYDNSQRIKDENLLDIMCAAPDGRISKSRICPGQRSGYDVCPACERGKEILSEAYTPLFGCGADYAQILDQNHGGGQYLCYSKKHGHPPVPGAWMTGKMQEMLSEWKKRSPGMILGCESATAEPFIGMLPMSDDRYELSSIMGRPVPLYAFLFHEYIRNFMGNQVSDPLPRDTDALLYRLAYSFAAGDVPTLVLTPEGNISPSWGTRDFSVMPDKETVLKFLKTLSDARNSGLSDFLNYGRMIPSPTLKCGLAPFGNSLPALVSVSWEYQSKKIMIVINPFEQTVSAACGGRDISVPGRSVVKLRM